jgi:hypothetical protein
MPATAKKNGRPTVKGLNETVNRLQNEMAKLASGQEITREDIAAYLGWSFGNKRNLYRALGWKADIDYSDYLTRYRRQDLAKAVVDIPIDASWDPAPTITESRPRRRRSAGRVRRTQRQTEFDRRAASLIKQSRLFHFCERVDTLGALGEYAVMLLGVKDGRDLAEPIGTATELNYLAPYSMKNAAARTFEEDDTNPRFSLPVMYDVSIGKSTKRPVHYSRIIHVANGLLESPTRGTPALEAVYNQLCNLELIAGSAAEMFWRGALMGLFLTNRTGAEMTMTPEQIADQFQKFFMDFQRHIALSDAEMKTLAPQVASPKDHADLAIKLVGAERRIPQRVLVGTEEGRLAAAQDDVNLAKSTGRRRTNFCEPVIVRPFFDTMIEVGILPPPRDDEYVVEWPSLQESSDQEKATRGKTIIEGIKAYVDAIGADQMYPPDMALKHLGLTPEEVEEAAEFMEQLQRLLDERERSNGDGGEPEGGENEPDGEEGGEDEPGVQDTAGAVG